VARTGEACDPRVIVPVGDFVHLTDVVNANIAALSSTDSVRVVNETRLLHSGRRCHSTVRMVSA